MGIEVREQTHEHGKIIATVRDIREGYVNNNVDKQADTREKHIHVQEFCISVFRYTSIVSFALSFSRQMGR